MLMTSNIYLKLIVVSHRGQYLDHYFSLIYVNDFYLECKLKNVLFADDTNFFISDENIGEIFHQMNKELKSV